MVWFYSLTESVQVVEKHHQIFGQPTELSFQPFTIQPLTQLSSQWNIRYDLKVFDETTGTDTNLPEWITFIE